MSSEGAIAFKQLLHLVWNNLQRRPRWLDAQAGKISPGLGLRKPREEGGGCLELQETYIPTVFWGFLDLP